MDKAQMRSLVRSRRAALTGHERAEAETAAIEHLLSLPALRAADVVLAYASHGDELRTDDLLTSVVARGAELLLPRVHGDELQVVAITGLGQLQPGFRGVREPTGAPVPAGRIDVAVVPGVAFDRAGGRLGQGGGHYDRLLAQLPAGSLRVGLAFEVQVVDRVPRADHDEHVDVLVTEAGTARTLARGSA